MPSPRPPGSGVEKILVSSHEIPEDHVLHLVVFTCCSSKPGVRFFAGRLWFFLFLGSSSPGLSLAAFRTPLPFPTGCSTVSGEVSHFVTIVTLHLGGVPASLSLCSMISISRGKWRLLILLVPRRRFVVSQRKSSLRPRSCRCVHRVCIGYGWTWRRKEPSQVVRFGGAGPKPL